MNAPLTLPKVRPLLGEGGEVVPPADEIKVAGDGWPIRDEHNYVHQSQLTWWWWPGRCPCPTPSCRTAAYRPRAPAAAPCRASPRPSPRPAPGPIRGEHYHVLTNHSSPRTPPRPARWRSSTQPRTCSAADAAADTTWKPWKLIIGIVQQWRQ